MESSFGFLALTPEIGTSGSFVDGELLVIAVMSLAGAIVVPRLTKIETSFDFSVNYIVMLASCLLVNSIFSKPLAPVGNELVASALAANFGMTLAGFVLLFRHRKSD